MFEDTAVSCLVEFSRARGRRPRAVSSLDAVHSHFVRITPHLHAFPRVIQRACGCYHHHPWANSAGIDIVLSVIFSPAGKLVTLLDQRPDKCLQMAGTNRELIIIQETRLIN